jgi:hypothetical protein
MAVEEWDRRQLCSDGGCTGIINATGVCGTCGRAAPNWGDERKRGLRNPTDAPPIIKDDDDIAPSAPAALGAMADWGTRRLCTDGGCIGVIGANNKCKTCGKPGPARKAKPAAAGVAAGSDSELARVAAEMAGTATAGDLASIEPDATKGDASDDEEYEDDEEADGDEYEDDDAEEASDEDHDHGDENDRAEADDESDDASDDEEEDEDDEDSDDEDDEDSDDDEDGDVEGDEDGTISASGARELCPDGACVGVLGANGRCKICDKPRDWKDEPA